MNHKTVSMVWFVFGCIMIFFPPIRWYFSAIGGIEWYLSIMCLLKDDERK